MHLYIVVFLFCLCFALFFFLVLLNKTMTRNFVDRIVFINLDRRPDRKGEIEGELKKVGLKNFERFAAIADEKNGAIGCCKSHLAVLKKAKERKYKNVLVLEDDFEFLVDKAVLFSEIEKLSKVPFDACLLAYNTPNLYDSDHAFLYKITDAQTASGYIVQAHYYDTLINCWEEALRKFEETGDEAHYTCDQSWKALQAKDSWFCFKTRIGKQRKSYSDIIKGEVDYNV